MSQTKDIQGIWTALKPNLLFCWYARGLNKIGHQIAYQFPDARILPAVIQGSRTFAYMQVRRLAACRCKTYKLPGMQRFNAQR